MMASKGNPKYTVLSGFDSSIEESRRIDDDMSSSSSSTMMMTSQDGGDVKTCVGFCTAPIKAFFYAILCILSCGVLLLLSYWKPQWRLYLTSERCNMERADSVLITNKEDEVFVEHVIVRVDEEEEVPLDSDVDELNVQASLINAERRMTLKTFHHFIHRHQRYVLDKKRDRFFFINGLEAHTCTDLHKLSGGLLTSQTMKKCFLYGKNVIDVQVKPYWKLLYQEVLDPFYVFQFASIIFWCTDEYYYYAGAIFFISCVSITLSLRQMRKHLEDLRNMVATPCETTIIRDGMKRDVLSDKILPGDVLVIPSNGLTMPCDAVLLTGTCRVNESMLTGESVPVNKTELPGRCLSMAGSRIYSSDFHKIHTLFCGTEVLQARFYSKGMVVALVTKTGFSTAKGDLVRAILFPKEVGFKFFRDALYFVGVLSIFALIGFIYSVVLFVSFHDSNKQIIFRAFDLITTVVPPALPASMTVGIMYAIQRLKKKKIYCISPPKVNVSGKIKLVCFDKTGTLTEEGLDFHGVIPLENNSLQIVVRDVRLLPQGHLVSAMATCHELTVQNGRPSGDPLDVKMFEATQDWIYEEPGIETEHYDQVIEGEIRHKQSPPQTMTSEGGMTSLISSERLFPHFGVLKRFPFISDLQRMSVIVASLHDVNSHPIAYTKGAPEMIAKLCLPSTIPANFRHQLDKLTQQGFRVIAFAEKRLAILRVRALQIEREQVECDLNFLGLLVMQNKLKPETTPVINELHRAALRTVMVTGDNILTAVSVARECNIIQPNQKVIGIETYDNDFGDVKIRYNVIDNFMTDEEREIQRRILSDRYQHGRTGLTPPKESEYVFAITGKSFGVIYSQFPDVLDRISVRGAVFARMLPEQKAQIVQSMQKLGYNVCMCGDGANDCGALKTANAGISLSEAEASVASPFTSKVANITCVPILIKEGRAALATSFSVFKYMALYSLVEFATVLILYSIDSNLGDWQYLYIDLILVLIVALVMERTGACEHLVRRRPSGSLVSFPVLFSVVGQIILQILTQVLAYYYVRSQPWFTPVHINPDSDNVMCYENTVLFCVSCFQYIALAIAFSTGAPYRKPMYTNTIYLVSVIVLTLLTIYMTVYPFEFLMEKVLQLKLPDDIWFRVALVEISGVAFVLSIVFDHAIVPSSWLRRFWVRVRRKRKPKNRYKVIEKGMLEDSSWPPIECEARYT
ncbi:polyamine-transporting ATPase 13A2-like isoform X2 [Oscarella lobularis]|uniref:polyamine-transporting ATPase 13A2-like isoform X2 n=1 Tax=Oscarella lobularis TaxID=121494 RepID=UPI0033142359